MSDCIFCKIINGEIPSQKVYEDDNMIVINDISPQAPVHMLMIPKEHYKSVAYMNDEQAVMLGKCLKKLAEVAKEKGIESYRLITNNGDDACQSVHHLHVHLLAGKKLAETMG